MTPEEMITTFMLHGVTLSVTRGCLRFQYQEQVLAEMPRGSWELKSNPTSLILGTPCALVPHVVMHSSLETIPPDLLRAFLSHPLTE